MIEKRFKPPRAPRGYELAIIDADKQWWVVGAFTKREPFMYALYKGKERDTLHFYNYCGPKGPQVHPLRPWSWAWVDLNEINRDENGAWDRRYTWYPIQ